MARLHTPDCTHRSYARGDELLDHSDVRLVSPIERPLTDALSSNQPGLTKNLEVLARRRLAHLQLPRDQDAAHAIAYQVAIHLRRKMSRRLPKPVQDLQPAPVCQRPQGGFDLHFNLL